MQDDKNSGSPPKLIWPRYALAAVIIFIALAVLWVAAAVKKTREQNAWNPLPGQSVNTNSSAP